MTRLAHPEHRPPRRALLHALAASLLLACLAGCGGSLSDEEEADGGPVQTPNVRCDLRPELCR